MVKARTLALLFSLLSTLPAAAQDAARPLTGDEIVSRMTQRNRERASELRAYVGCRHYQLNYAGFPASKSAAMSVEAAYEAPGKKQFRVVEEHGSKLILTKVFHKLLESEQEAQDEANRRASALNTDNYTFALLGQETIGGRRQYIMQVTPRAENKFLYRGKIWLDAEDFAVTRISAEPAKNPSFWISHTNIEHEYAKVGQFYLPAQNSTVTKVKLGGTATLSIQYFGYQVGAAQAGATGARCESVAVSEVKAR